MSWESGQLLPVERLAGLRLTVTPSSILRWHREILRRALNLYVIRASAVVS